MDRSSWPAAMCREQRVESLVKKTRDGLGVDRINTRTLSIDRVEGPRLNAIEYIGDGHGNIRMMGIARVAGATQMSTGVYSYSYRRAGSKDWLTFGDYDSVNDLGLNPVAVDAARDVVYGFKKKDGRWAAYEVALNGSGQESIVYADPKVDVKGFLRVGRSRRVVGVRYTTDSEQIHYIDPVYERMRASLAKALPGSGKILIVDASADENRLLLLAASDIDPGTYYLFDRQSKQMSKVMDVRPDIAKSALGVMKAISYRAADGTAIPAYISLPPNAGDKKLPAIVMPHGGPESRDEWGFDWLAQFFVSRGYAVIQPQFRGSAGYGDEWLMKNGFQSWRTAINDINDAGRWAISEGIADPGKIAVVGWSYGGYAALQSAVVDPSLFKGVIAIAPVTDFYQLKEERRNWTNFRIVSDYIGSGPHIVDGSPAQNASRIKAPVLLFHGDLDRNVRSAQSRLMDSRLASAGVAHEYVQFPKLDHYLEDSAAREQMLRKSDEFLRKAMGM